MRHQPYEPFTRSTGRDHRGGEARSELAIIAVLVVVFGIGAAGLLSSAFGSSGRAAAESSQHQVSRQITERTKRQSATGKPADQHRP